MPFYQSSGIKLHYVSRGAVSSEPHHPVLVFEHGIGGDISQPGRFLAPERTRIPGDKLTIIHADFRGHGQSELGRVEDLSIATLAEDLGALLDHLGIERAMLGGISMGAAVALRLAARWPERCQALILCRPAWNEDGMSQEAREALAFVAELLSSKEWRETAIEQLERSEILASLDQVCPDAGRSLRQQVRSILSRPQARVSRIACLRQLPCSGGFDHLDRDLEGVRCPTLILAAEGDPVHPWHFAVRIAEALPDCRLLEIKPKSPRDELSHFEEVDHEIGGFVGLLFSPAEDDESGFATDRSRARIETVTNPAGSIPRARPDQDSL